jgi:hypothetical protein
VILLLLANGFCSQLSSENDEELVQIDNIINRSRRHLARYLEPHNSLSIQRAVKRKKNKEPSGEDF